MFTPMLSAPGSRRAGLEGMQKWVRLTQLELRKLIRVPALHKHRGFPGPPLPLAAVPCPRRNGHQVAVCCSLEAD